MMRASPPGAIRWTFVLTALATAFAFLGLAPGITGGVAIGVALGALSSAFFFWRLSFAEQLPAPQGARLVRFGTITRFLLIIVVVWLLQAQWPAVNMVAVLGGFFAAWAVFALATAGKREKRS